MEKNKTEKKETDTYFEERIAKIHEIRTNRQSVENKIVSLVSIADDFELEKERLIWLKCKRIHDLQLLFDTMINMAEDRVIEHKRIVMDDFLSLINSFQKITQTQNNPAEEKYVLTDSCEEILKHVKELRSTCSEVETKLQRANHNEKILVSALNELERYDKDNKDLMRELKNKPKEVEERVLMNLIEIAKNKPLSTRQGLKSLLQDYVSKNNVTIGLSNFQQELAALDDERPEIKAVVKGDFVQNKYVTKEVNNVESGGVGINA